MTTSRDQPLVLTNPALHIGQTYRPTGPKLLAGHDIAAIFAKVLGERSSSSMSRTRCLLKYRVEFSTVEIAQVRHYNDDHRWGVRDRHTDHS